MKKAQNPHNGYISGALWLPQSTKAMFKRIWWIGGSCRQYIKSKIITEQYSFREKVKQYGNTSMKVAKHWNFKCMALTQVLVETLPK